MNAQIASATSTVTEEAFRNGVMPRAQLSKLACEIASGKATREDVKQFAGWELMEATTVINILEDLDTPASPMSNDAKAFLSKLKSLNGKEFDTEYMAAELSNHEFLRDLAQDYIDGVDEKILGNDKDTFHVASLALFAFTEHIGLCKRIYAEVNAN